MGRARFSCSPPTRSLGRRLPRYDELVSAGALCLVQGGVGTRHELDMGLLTIPDGEADRAGQLRRRQASEPLEHGFGELERASGSATANSSPP